MHHRRAVVAVVMVLGLAVAVSWLCHADRGAVVRAAEPDKAQPTLAELHAEIEQLKQLLPDQAHVMQDVSYHFTNLWFAGQQQNWALAEFYLGETKSHLRWAVRVRPKRKDSQDREIDLAAILQAVENTPLKQLGETLAAKNREQFEHAYRTTLVPVTQETGTSRILIATGPMFS